MNSRILIDTNILLDYILTREPFYEDAKNIDAAHSLMLRGLTKRS